MQQGNSESSHASIPPNWIPFFMSLLASTDHFEWTKDLLRTGMTALFDDDKGMISLPLPKKPSTGQSVCLTELDNNSAEKQTEVNQSQQSKDRGTTDKRKVPTKMATPLVDTQVRRSERVKKGNKGFKTPGCPKINCTACSPTPPSLSSKTIRNLGTQFCGMEYEELADEQLMRKDMKADRALKKKLRKEDGKEDKEDERNEEQQED